MRCSINQWGIHTEGENNISINSRNKFYIDTSKNRDNMSSDSDEIITMKSNEIMVRDIMIKNVITVFNFKKLDEAARLMTENKIGCLIVFAGWYEG